MRLFQQSRIEPETVLARVNEQTPAGLQDLFDAADLPLFPWQIAPKHRFVRIVPDELTGRQFHVNPDAIAAQTAYQPERRIGHD